MTDSAAASPTSDSIFRLRPGFLLACLVSLAAGVSGFYGGKWWERGEAEKRQAQLTELAVGSDKTTSLFLLRTILAQLHAGDTKQAEAALLRVAKLQIPDVERCRASVECRSWNRAHMPSQAELQELAVTPEPK